MIQGYVKKVNTKDGKGKRGPWTLYSCIIEQDDGTESGWISCGFDKPPFAEGSYISLETSKDGNYTNLVPGSVKQLDPPKRAPAPTAQGMATGGSPAPAERKDTYVNTQDSIVYQSSRKDALALVALLLENDALPMSASAAKAGIAKRFEEITAFVDKLTVQYVRDVQTGRVLQSVVDAGAESPATAGRAASAEGSTPDND
jgi:hypothetical protein